MKAGEVNGVKWEATEYAVSVIMPAACRDFVVPRGHIPDVMEDIT